MTPEDEAELRAEYAAFGWDSAQIEKLIKEETPDDFEVLEENWPALIWFNDVSDLMKLNGNAYLGLDIIAVKYDAEMSERNYTATDYTKLKQLGRFAAVELNKQIIKK
jgi:hypothetical protein